MQITIWTLLLLTTNNPCSEIMQDYEFTYTLQVSPPLIWRGEVTMVREEYLLQS